MLRTYLYTPDTITVDAVCDAFKINVDVRFIDSKSYRKFIIYHMVPFSERRIYERLGIELHETLAMPSFMLCGLVPRDTTTEVKTGFKRVTVPTKRREFTFNHTYFQPLP